MLVSYSGLRWVVARQGVKGKLSNTLLSSRSSTLQQNEFVAGPFINRRDEFVLLNLRIPQALLEGKLCDTPWLRIFRYAKTQ